MTSVILPDQWASLDTPKGVVLVTCDFHFFMEG